MPEANLGYIKIPFQLPDFEQDMMLGMDRNFKEIERLFNVMAKRLNVLTPELSPLVHEHDDLYLNKENEEVYTPTDDYNPATKKYVDDAPVIADTVYTQEIKTDLTEPNDLAITTGADKTLVLNTPVYNDINTGLNPRNTGANRPVLATMTGGISEFQFEVNDYADLAPIELLHDWKEGSEIQLHLHWATGGENDGTARGVKWEMEYAYAEAGSVFSAPQVVTGESVIAANEPALTHRFTSIATFTPATTIGTQLSFKVKRIASEGTAPVADPFLLSIGVHYQICRLGSRTISEA